MGSRISQEIQGPDTVLKFWGVLCLDKNSIVPESVIANMQAYHVSAWNAEDMGREDPLEKEMATQSSTLAWRIPWSEEPGRLQSMVS